MKKILFVLLIIINTVMAYSQTPNYTIETTEDGRIFIICPTDDDFLILLNRYNLPDRFCLVLQVKDIYFERWELPEHMERLRATMGNVLFTLRGTKFTNPGDYGYEHGMSIFNSKNYNVRRNTPYYILFDVEKSINSSAIMGYPVYSSIILVVLDINMNPLE